MTRQNRVTPFSDIVATPERGTLMGNRGALHDEQGRIRRPWQVKRWLLCLLEFKQRKRSIMTPGHYTELFFLDEATGLAAGHRPCFECQRQRFNAFCRAWLAGNPGSSSKGIAASGIDDQLHDERLAPAAANAPSWQPGRIARWRLPGGGQGEENAFLLWHDHLLDWSPGGYRQRWPRPKGEQVSVLTPPSTVAAIRAGFVPHIHESARLPDRGVVLINRSASFS